MKVVTTKRGWSLALAMALGTGPVAVGGPQAPQTPPGEPPTFSVQSAAVLLDVVVRDKSGKLVRDLKAEEFELYEDGVKQTIESFRIVDLVGPARAQAPAQTDPAAAAGAPAAPSAPSAAASPEPAEPEARPSSLIAFVFDRLTPEARKVAQKAALTYVDRGHVEGDVVAVFGIDLALSTLQPFTRDKEAVRQGFQRALTAGNTAFASDRAEARARQDAVTRADATLDALAGQGQEQLAALVAVQQVSDRMQMQMLQAFDAMERDQQGFASTNGLMAVVNGLRSIPGRKTIVFFSEGLAVPSNVMGQFRSVIASANRANVTIYAIDAGGLRLDSGTEESRKELVQTSQRRLRQEASGGSDLAGIGPMNKEVERSEDMRRLDPAANLGQLADETGGFLVHSTNDARAGFGRITEEMRFHYLLSYAPTNEKLDGRFRTIAVKVRRPDARVQTRKGYFAVRPDYAIPIRAHEAPALAQLDASPRPHAFPIGVAALSFPETNRGGLVPVLVQVPGSALRYVAGDQASKEQRADLSVVVRIKNESGREVDRLSQQYRLSARPDQLEAARKGDILFYKETELPPGRYQAEAVAYDAMAEAASVGTSAVEVPSAEKDPLRLSSLLLLKRAEKLTAAEVGGANPLYFGETVVYPYLGEPVRKSVASSLGFFFTAYGGQTTAPHKATVELRQGERTLLKAGMDLAAADAKGRIQHAAALPVQNLAVGSYQLRVTVTDGARSVAQETPFTIAE